ncbi:N-acetyltransferase [Cytophagales bacterium WSM2-2]|nr:N-acetyltransferase [Cytophagales bacterium WSM2-2]
MIQVTRTNSDHPDFIALVKELDILQAVVDGDDHAYYTQFNSLNKIKHVVLAHEDGQALGCGGIKEYEKDSVEVKRMFVSPAARKKGIASTVLSELERWAKELKYTRCVLETHTGLTEAIAFYQKSGYKQIPNYGQYAEMENSVCFEKKLN